MTTVGGVRMEGDSSSWFIQVNEDVVCGPLSVATLCQWAEEGRIAPGASLSVDRQTWRSADSLSLLQMDWFLERADGGREGPYNWAAIPRMVNLAALEPAAVFRHRVTGERRAAPRAGGNDARPQPPPAGRDGVRAPAADGRREGAAVKRDAMARLPATAGPPSADSGPVEDPNAQVARMEKEDHEAAERMRRLEEELAAERIRRNAEIEQFQRREQELLARIEEMADEDLFSTSLLEDAKRHIDRLKMGKAPAPRKPTPDEDLSRHVDELRREARLSVQMVEKLVRELNNEKIAHAKTRASRNRRERDLIARIRGGEERLRTASREMEQGRDELLRAKKMYQDLLNDTLQKERKAVGEPPAAARRPELPLWHLRLDEQSVFGPVPLAALLDWARECRIGPDHLVSTDKQSWRPAKDVAELKMEWMVTLGDGSPYGPLNAFAVQHLMRDGAISPDATVTHIRTGQTAGIDELLLSEIRELRERNAQLENDVRLAWERMADERERSRDIEKRLGTVLSAHVASRPPAAHPSPFVPPELVRRRIGRQGERESGKAGG